MNRILQSLSRSSTPLAAAVLTAAMVVGCGSSHEYKPEADPQHLTAYAASLKYPSDVQAMDNPRLTAIIDAGNNQLTIHNYGEGPVLEFNLWLNQTYVLHVDKLPAGSYRVFTISDFYSAAGNNDLSPKDVKTVQVQTGDNKLMTAQGPQQM